MLTDGKRCPYFITAKGFNQKNRYNSFMFCMEFLSYFAGNKEKRGNIL